MWMIVLIILWYSIGFALIVYTEDVIKLKDLWFLLGASCLGPFLIFVCISTIMEEHGEYVLFGEVKE